LNQLDIAEDGSFEVIFSSERPEGYQGDWLYLHPESRFLLLRQFSYDWGNERDVKVCIERLGEQPLKPRMSVATIDQQ
ncbi:hypothetical protein SB759_36135, partial [Pseudomonas sp. SIMBA_059]